jgi:hypothetical protein
MFNYWCVYEFLKTKITHSPTIRKINFHYQISTKFAKTIHCLLRNKAEFEGEKRAYKNFFTIVMENPSFQHQLNSYWWASFMMKYTLLVYFLNTKHEGYSKRIGRTMSPVHQWKPYLIECMMKNSNKPGALKSIYLKIIHVQFGFFFHLFF